MVPRKWSSPISALNPDRSITSFTGLRTSAKYSSIPSSFRSAAISRSAASAEESSWLMGEALMTMA